MTITLDQSRKLWELGVRKEAEKAWWQDEYDQENYILDGAGRMGFGKIKPHAYAYSSEELIAMMQGMYQIYIRQDKRVEIYTEPYSDEKTPMYKTLTQALCNKLIYDIENGIITVEEINK